MLCVHVCCLCWIESDKNVVLEKQRSSSSSACAMCFCSASNLEGPPLQALTESGSIAPAEQLDKEKATAVPAQELIEQLAQSPQASCCITCISILLGLRARVYCCVMWRLPAAGRRQCLKKTRGNEPSVPAIDIEARPTKQVAWGLSGGAAVATNEPVCQHARASDQAPQTTISCGFIGIASLANVD